MGPVIEWLKVDQEPPSHEISLAGPETKELWIHRELLQFNEHGVLLSSWVDPSLDQSHLCVVVLQCITLEVSHSIHDIPVSGHPGQEKIFQERLS